MHSSAWAALLRHIPADHQNQLMLGTVGGTEIAVQCFLRVDHEFVALKGRLAGSQDAGRVFFIPYTQIDCLAYMQAVKESEFQETYGGMVVPEPPAAFPAEGASRPEADQGLEAKPGSGPRPVIRSEVLERFRSNRPASSPQLPRPARNGDG